VPYALHAEMSDSSEFAYNIEQDVVTGNNIIDSTIFAVDIGNEPGVAQSLQGAQITLPDANPGIVYTITECEINCPAEGYVYASGRFYATVNHINGRDDTQVGISISESPGTMTDVNTQMQWSSSPDALPTGFYTNTLNVSHIFQVDEGPKQLYLVAREGSAGPTEITINLGVLSLIYFPTAYGPIDQ